MWFLFVCLFGWVRLGWLLFVVCWLLGVVGCWLLLVVGCCWSVLVLLLVLVIDRVVVVVLLVMVLLLSMSSIVWFGLGSVRLVGCWLFVGGCLWFVVCC